MHPLDVDSLPAGVADRNAAPPGKFLPSSDPAPMVRPQMTNAPTILVVEDEEDSVILLENAFRKAQFVNPVHRVSHGALAMEYLSNAVDSKKRTVPLPALVLLDLKLPLVSGLEVLRWIRAHPVLHSLIVIVFTSSTEPRDIAEAYRAGANSYLVKPTTVNSLKELAGQVRDYWLRLNVPPNEPRV
jgi:two-component system response regulator